MSINLRTSIMKDEDQTATGNIAIINLLITFLRYNIVNRLDYLKMLNSNLPDDIRILSCSRVDD